MSDENDWEEVESDWEEADWEGDVDESMDGDHASALASAGFGTDEDYGGYGSEADLDDSYEDYGVD